MRELRHACHHVGFFQLRHDLPEGLANRVFEAGRRFFAQPLQCKLKMDYRKSAAFRGYMPLGVENTAGKPDMREQIEIAAEEALAASTAWPAHERLRGPNQWPADGVAPELRWERLYELDDVAIPRCLARLAAISHSVAHARRGVVEEFCHHTLRTSNELHQASSSESGARRRGLGTV